MRIAMMMVAALALMACSGDSAAPVEWECVCSWELPNPVLGEEVVEGDFTECSASDPTERAEAAIEADFVGTPIVLMGCSCEDTGEACEPD